MADAELLTYALAGDVARLGLNRPAKRNAISEELLAQLDRAIARAQGEARAIVIHGHGPCFCAGLDLAEQRRRNAAEVFHLPRDWHALFSRIRLGRVPAIAALHGATVGGGLRWALLGPFLNLHLSGGPGGIGALFEKPLWAATEGIWRDLGTVQVDAALGADVAAGVARELAPRDPGEMVRQRDATLLALLALLRLKAAAPELP